MNLENHKKKILIIDDEPLIRESLRMLLSPQYLLEFAEGGRQALSIIEQQSERTLPDLAILDVMMPDIDGITVLRTLHDHHPEIPVLMLTASNSLKTAVESMKIGAVDFVSKPFEVEDLISLINGLLVEDTERKPAKLPKNGSSQPRKYRECIGDFGALVGSCAPMKELYQKLEQVAVKDTTLLITGESGTGKELVAREVHRRSPRAERPFVALNCAAIPESLIESELFGHERGAFTHASEKRLGQFELADSGTLFLDEIGELSPAVQVKILRFLQSQELYRVGLSTPIHLDVRIIAATNKDLLKAIENGSFRRDLFYRINVVHLDICPLRQRGADISLLAEKLVERLAETYGREKLMFSQDALEALSSYSWPGNVRELENVIESLLALLEKPTVELNDLPATILAESQFNRSKQNFDEAERTFERDMILDALKKSNYVQTRAAEALGITRRILKYKMDRLGIPAKP